MVTLKPTHDLLRLRLGLPVPGQNQTRFRPHQELGWLQTQSPDQSSRNRPRNLEPSLTAVYLDKSSEGQGVRGSESQGVRGSEGQGVRGLALPWWAQTPGRRPLQPGSGFPVCSSPEPGALWVRSACGRPTRGPSRGADRRVHQVLEPVGQESLPHLSLICPFPVSLLSLICLSPVPLLSLSCPSSVSHLSLSCPSPVHTHLSIAGG